MSKAFWCGLQLWPLWKDVRGYLHDSFKMDLLLHKSEPISQAGGASVKRYSRKGKKHSTIQTQTQKKGWEKYKINSPADSKVSEGGQGGGSGAGEISVQPMEKRKHCWEACQPCPMEGKGGEDILCSLWRISGWAKEWERVGD